jgi:hypothetical protein
MSTAPPAKPAAAAPAARAGPFAALAARVRVSLAVSKVLEELALDRDDDAALRPDDDAALRPERALLERELPERDAFRDEPDAALVRLDFVPLDELPLFGMAAPSPSTFLDSPIPRGSAA